MCAIFHWIYIYFLYFSLYWLLKKFNGSFKLPHVLLLLFAPSSKLAAALLSCRVTSDWINVSNVVYIWLTSRPSNLVYQSGANWRNPLCSHLHVQRLLIHGLIFRSGCTSIDGGDSRMRAPFIALVSNQ